ncbi:MAG: hypothetical protein V3U07_00070, partial [Nitrospirales bacterium]
MSGPLPQGKTDKKRDACVSPPDTSVMKEGVGVEDQEKALESLARVLRSLGRHAFELEQLSEEAIEKEFERWALHVLVGTPIMD